MIFERGIFKMRIMMFLLLGMAFVSIQTGVVFAAKNSDTGPGCGLGTLAWADYKHPKNIAPQVMMATTNGTLFNTVGISFGLSGCTNDGVVMAEHRAEMFVASTFESLSQDMARGQGEHLASLATMMGVPIEYYPAFFSLIQERYRILMERGESSPRAVIKAIQEAVVGGPMLAGIAPRP
jgi:Protein of unknown function (DUF3015)